MVALKMNHPSSAAVTGLHVGQLGLLSAGIIHEDYRAW